MLTPTDIHDIVGLLSQASHPEIVELELVSYVYDQTMLVSLQADYRGWHQAMPDSQRAQILREVFCRAA